MASVAGHVFYGAGPGRIPTIDDVKETLAALEDADRCGFLTFTPWGYSNRCEIVHQRQRVVQLRLDAWRGSVKREQDRQRKAARTVAERETWQRYQEVRTEAELIEDARSAVAAIQHDARLKAEREAAIERNAQMQQAAVDAQNERRRQEAIVRRPTLIASPTPPAFHALIAEQEYAHG